MATNNSINNTIADNNFTVPNGSITASGNIASTLGNVTAGAAISSGTTITAGSSVIATTTITAGTGITSTAGNITASSGNVVITAGNLNFANGIASVLGIDGVNVGSVARVVTEAGNRLGTAIITAGVGITVTAGANTITIASSGTSTLTYTTVNTSPYVVLGTDEFLGVDSSGGPIQINLPNAPSTGRTFTIKDTTGSANTNSITVTTVGGVVLVDAAATYVMNTQYAAIDVLFNGTKYLIY